MSKTVAYGFGKEVKFDVESTKAKVTEELAKEGFGILTEIDVTATMKKKLGVDFRKYLILGACNPQIAHQALSEELELGLLLPCNVVLYETGTGKMAVQIADPYAMMEVTGNPRLTPLAEEAKKRLQRALAAL